MEGTISPIFTDIRARRLALRLTQADVARRAGLTQTYLSKLEQGKIEPRLHTLEDLARALSFEILLIPAELVPTVRSLSHSSENPKPLFAAEPD